MPSRPFRSETYRTPRLRQLSELSRTVNLSQIVSENVNCSIFTPVSLKREADVQLVKPRLTEYSKSCMVMKKKRQPGTFQMPSIVGIIRN